MELLPHVSCHYEYTPEWRFHNHAELHARIERPVGRGPVYQLAYIWNAGLCFTVPIRQECRVPA
jgi:hypothetical protein